MKLSILLSMLLFVCASNLLAMHITFTSEHTGDITIRIWRAILHANRGQLISQLFLPNNTNLSRDIHDDGPYWFEAVVGNDFNHRLRTADDLENDRSYTFCMQKNRLMLREADAPEANAQE